MQFYRTNRRKIALLSLLTTLQFIAAGCTELDPSSASQGDETTPVEDYTPPSADSIDLNPEGLDGLIEELEADEMPDDPCVVCVGEPGDAPGPVTTPVFDQHSTFTTTTTEEETSECSSGRLPTPKYGGDLRRAWKLILELGEGFGKLAARWASLGLKWTAVKVVDSMFAKIAGRKWSANLFKLNDYISKIARIKRWDAATKLDKLFSVYARYAKRTRATLKIAAVTAVAMALAGKGFSWLWDQLNPWGSGKKLEQAKKDLNKRIDDLAEKVKPGNMLTEEQKVNLVDDLLAQIQKEADEIKAMPQCTEEQRKARKDAFEAWKKKYAPYLDLIKGLKQDLEGAEKVMKDTAEFMGEIKKTLDGIAAAEGDVDKYIAAVLADIPDDEADGLDDDALKQAKAAAVADAGLTPEEIASLGD